jgi:hypothetical protein
LKGKQKLLTDNLAHQSENDFSNQDLLFYKMEKSLKKLYKKK